MNNKDHSRLLTFAYKHVEMILNDLYGQEKYKKRIRALEKVNHQIWLIDAKITSGEL